MKNNQISVAKYLVDRGSEVDAVGGELMATPLQWASRNGHIQMVTFLFKKGADPLIRDNQGYNSLHLAAHAGHSMMITYLVAVGVDVDAPDTMGRTALMWAAYQGNSSEAMNVLIKHKANVDRTDSTGFSALHWAVISHHLSFAKILIQAGSSTDLKDPSGKTPADWAKERGHFDRYEAIVKECSKGRARGGQPFSKDTTHKLIYSMPFIQIPLVILLFSYFDWYFAAVFAGACMYILNVQFVFGYLMKGDNMIITTPMTTSIPQATILFTAITWLQILPCNGPFCLVDLN
ncbi:Palmitoyltransferase zdhhc13 [Irineochytrium annulatum]|nr:Palmitoyltransferase zdhhc13 [Irineochytrium annulatum]